MNNSELASHSFDRLLSAVQEPENNNRKQFLKIFAIWSEFSDSFLKNESLHFSSRLAKTLFIIDKFPALGKLSKQLQFIGRFAGRLRKNSRLFCHSDDCHLAAFVIAESISIIADNPISGELTEITEIYRNIFVDDKSDDPSKLQTDNIHAVIVSKGRYVNHNEKAKSNAELICESEQFGTIRVILFGLWLDIYDYCKSGDSVNLIGFKQDKLKPDKFISTFDSIVVYEPDYLIDVTDIANCFVQEGYNPNLYLLKKFFPVQTNGALLAGKYINTLFDDILVEPDIEFTKAYDNALKEKPLSIFALSMKNRNDAVMVRQKALSHFENLKAAAAMLKSDYLSIEPSFISPLYGLQGRLDAMLEYSDEPSRKDVIELKSGKAPSLDMLKKTTGGAVLKTGIYQSHSAQICCYNLLLETAYDNRSGSSQILYSSDSYTPLRNAMLSQRDKQEVIACRNRIASFEKSLAGKDYSVLENLSAEKFGLCPPYTESEVFKFNNAYKSLSALDKDYLQNFISFISQESFIEKTGYGERGGFSDLWNQSPFEKELAYSALTQLEFLEAESDFDNMHIVFSRNGGGFDASPFRDGDICIVQPDSDSSEGTFKYGQLVKCSIKKISGDRVVVSLRNKMFRRDFFHSAKYWTLEPDYIDSSGKALYRSLFTYVSSVNRIKKVLYGIDRPRFDETIFNTFDERLASEYRDLNDNQFRLLKYAAAAKDYYLIQGPPGTGKTSYMLKSITKSHYENSDGNILLLAYTNRAVDEICSALKDISPEIDFLRLGNKDSSQHKDKLLSQLAEQIDLRELFNKAKAIRVFVSTVASAHSNPELFEFKNFDMAIIDEASQILEPQLIGILCKVSKFVMIGDEKQLPAVVVQPESGLIVDSEELKNIGIENLGSSLFERLLKNALKNDWHDAYGLLRYQARMHTDIMHIANELFYDGQLEIFSEIARLSSVDKRFSADSDDDFERRLSMGRALFIPCKSGGAPKTSLNEVTTAISLVNTIKEVYGADFNENTVGIISPFRAQCAMLKAALPDELRAMVAVDTVERFQGSQKDVIIISFAVGNAFLLKSIVSESTINGMTIDRKLNVAITRAREHLVLLGNPSILRQSPIHKKLIDLCKK